jgi:hypothetical protein
MIIMQGKKMDLHVLPCNTNFYKSVINMRIRLYSNVPVNIKKLKEYKAFKREL